MSLKTLTSPAWKLKKTIFAIILLMGLLVGCGGPERKYIRGNSEYLPLAQQRVMKYEEKNEGETREFTISFHYLGGRKTKIFGARYKGKKPDYNEFQEQDSLVNFVTENPLTKLQPEKTTIEYSEAWVNENARPGDVWENEDTGTQTVLVGYESITVAAGNFANCYKTTTEAMPVLFDTLSARRKREELSDKEYETALANARTVVIRWFAPQVGLVKEQIGSEEHTVELLAVESEGIGDIDTSKRNETQELFFEEPSTQENN